MNIIDNIKLFAVLFWALHLLVGCQKSAVDAEIEPATLNDFMRLPAAFIGQIPCEDCESVDIILNIRSDSLYQLRKTYQSAEGPIKVDSQLGRWRFTPEDNLLILGKERGRLKTYTVLSNDLLRFVEWEGTDTAGQIQYDLVRLAEIDPFDDIVKMRGMFSFSNGQADFVECSSGVNFQVDQDGEYQTTIQSYLNTPHDRDVPLLLSMMGSLKKDKGANPPRETLFIDQFRRFYPNRDCDGNQIRASFTGTYWLLEELDGTVLEQNSPDEAMYLTFNSDRSIHGYGGCNRIAGTYLTKGDVFLFKRLATTRVACNNRMELENRLLEILSETETYRVDGDMLLLLDQNDQARARFIAGP